MLGFRRFKKRGTADAESDKEIRAHLELETEERVASGMSRDDARHAAARAFGPVAAAKEDCGNVWRPSASLERLIQDLRFAVRTMRKSPLFTIVAVLTLALGIGANTAIFSVVNGVLMKALPYSDPERLVTVLSPSNRPLSPADFLEIQRQSHSFATMAAAGGWSATLIGRDYPEQILGLQFTDGMFAMLGVPAMIGRTPGPHEGEDGKENIVVLSYRLWQRRFGGDRSIVGQSLTLNGAPYTVIGIMPPEFRFAPFWLTEAEMWSPFSLRKQGTDRTAHFLRPFARLRPGVPLAQAQAEIDTICRRLQLTYPDSDAGLSMLVEPLREKAVGDVRRALFVLLAAVGFVLLIACANVANLALARTAERQKEIAIRRAMGASWGRVFRQFLTESMLLSFAGGIIGVLLAIWGVNGLKLLITGGANRVSAWLPGVEQIDIDFNVLAFTALLSLITGIVFGFAPALQATRSAMNDSLKEGGRGSSEAGHSIRMRSALVITEVAVSLILLAGAGLLMRSFVRLRTLDPGFTPDRVLTMTVSVAGQPSYVGGKREAFFRQVLSDVKAIPGVRLASMVNHLPIGGDTWGANVFAEGQPVPERGHEQGAVWRIGMPGYLNTVGIRLLAGRDFTEQDDLKAPPVIIINDKLAKRFWPNESAIGKRVTPSNPRDGAPKWLTVVGVVANVRQSNWAKEPDEEFYIPWYQDKDSINATHPWRSYMTLVVRTDSDPRHIASAVQSTIWALNKNVPLSDMRTLDDIVASSLWQARFYVLLVGAFAVYAVVLAAIGIYGVMAYAVSRRTQEIGIRMALGAGQSTVVWLILRQTMLLVIAGVGIGLAAALVMTRFISTLLYGITPTDPITFTAIPALMAAVALTASYLPARRASSVDPAIALRWG